MKEIEAQPPDGKVMRNARFRSPVPTGRAMLREARTIGCGNAGALIVGLRQWNERHSWESPIVDDPGANRRRRDTLDKGSKSGFTFRVLCPETAAYFLRN